LQGDASERFLGRVVIGFVERGECGLVSLCGDAVCCAFVLRDSEKPCKPWELKNLLPISKGKALLGIDCILIVQDYGTLHNDREKCVIKYIQH
jgi:hypothetical protein